MYNLFCANISILNSFLKLIGHMYREPCVDIVMPSCNGVSFIREQVSSIQACVGYAELVRKLIIVDDSSDDDTLNILAQLADKDYRLEVVPNTDARRGVINNVAFGLSISFAPFILLSDQDDIWMPDKLTTLVKEMLRQQEVYGEGTPILGFSDLEVVDAELNKISPSFWSYQGIKPQWAGSLKQLLCQNVAPGCSMIFNQALLRKSLPFQAETVMHDWWLILVAKACGKVFWVEKALTRYRQHGHNQVGAKPSQGLLQLMNPQGIKRARVNLYNASAQARAFYAVFGREKLLDQDIEALQVFKNLPSYSFLARVGFVINGTIRKNSCVRNVALVMLMCLPPLKKESL